MELIVKLGTVGDTALFSAECSKYSEDIDYIVNSKCTLDAKSVVGVVSAGFGKKCTVKIHTDNENVFTKFAEDMRLWRNK